jgi:hypothetical protein
VCVLQYLWSVRLPGEGEEHPLENAGVDHIPLFLGVEIQLDVPAAKEEPHWSQLGFVRYDFRLAMHPESSEGSDAGAGAHHDDGPNRVLRHVEPRRAE